MSIAKDVPMVMCDSFIFLSLPYVQSPDNQDFSEVPFVHQRVQELR